MKDYRLSKTHRMPVPYAQIVTTNKLCILLTQYICAFHKILIVINTDYPLLPYKALPIGLLIFTDCVLCDVGI